MRLGCLGTLVTALATFCPSHTTPFTAGIKTAKTDTVEKVSEVMNLETASPLAPPPASITIPARAHALAAAKDPRPVLTVALSDLWMTYKSLYWLNLIPGIQND